MENFSMYKENENSPAINTNAHAWDGFTKGAWCETVDVREFIQANYTPYEGTDEFLAGATTRTKDVWAQVLELMKEVRESINNKEFSKLKRKWLKT